MPLSSDELHAFAQVARSGSFSRAAKLLYVTQSAISQRIAHLEQSLETKLLIREHHKVSLTPAGEELLRYFQFHEQLEHDLLQKFLAKRHETTLNGYIRIAAFSSVMRSAILPALTPLLLEHPNLQLEIRNSELDEMLQLLQRGEVDYIILDREIIKSECTSLFLGEEWNVLIEPLQENVPERYLDHDQNDAFTQRFLALQSSEISNAPRHFVDDVYGIIEGVELGLGRGIVAAHLLKSTTRVRVNTSYLPLIIPVWLHFISPPWETHLHKSILKALSTGVKKHLKHVFPINK